VSTLQQTEALSLSFHNADLVSVAQYILVVEKETGMRFKVSRLHVTIYYTSNELLMHAVFQRLANDKFCVKNRCIVVTVSSNLHSVFL
jgi:hypothetical protein